MFRFRLPQRKAFFVWFMQMKPRTIVNYLRTKARRPLKAKELARALGVPTREYRSFKSLLRELADSGAIYRVRRGRYASTEKLNLIVGRLQITRGGFGFVIPEEGGTDVFVRSSGLGNAYAEDRVVVRIDHPRRTPNPEGTIVKVLERSRTQVVGTFMQPFYLFTPLSVGMEVIKVSQNLGRENNFIFYPLLFYFYILLIFFYLLNTLD